MKITARSLTAYSPLQTQLDMIHMVKSRINQNTAFAEGIIRRCMSAGDYDFPPASFVFIETGGSETDHQAADSAVKLLLTLNHYYMNQDVNIQNQYVISQLYRHINYYMNQLRLNSHAEYRELNNIYKKIQNFSINTGQTKPDQASIGALDRQLNTVLHSIENRMAESGYRSLNQSAEKKSDKTYSLSAPFYRMMGLVVESSRVSDYKTIWKQSVDKQYVIEARRFLEYLEQLDASERMSVLEILGEEESSLYQKLRQMKAGQWELFARHMAERLEESLIPDRTCDEDDFLELKQEFFRLLEQTKVQADMEQIWELADSDSVMKESAKKWRTHDTPTTTLSEEKRRIKNWISDMDSQVWERFIRLATERSELSELTETSDRYSRFTGTEQEKRENLLHLFMENVHKTDTSQNLLTLKHEFFRLLEQTERQEEIEQIWKLTDADVVLMESAKDWRSYETTTTTLSEQKELIKNWIGYIDSQVWERFIRLASDRSELSELTGTSQRYSRFTETEQEKREHLLHLFVETVQGKNTSLNSLMLKHEFFRLLEQTERQEEIEQIWKLTDADVVLMESAKDWRSYETTTTTLSEQKELIKNWIGYMDSQVWERFIRLATERSELGELTGTSQRYSRFMETEQEKREYLLHLFVETVQEKNTSLNSLMLKHEFFRLLEQTERQEEIEQIWKLTDADVVLMESAKDWRTYETTTTTLSEQKELIKNWIGYMDSQVWERFIRLASDRSELSELTGTSQRYSRFTETEQEKREHLLHLFVETVQEKNTSLNSLMLKHEFFRLLEETEKQEEIEQIWKLTDADVVLMESAKDWRTYETTTTTLSEQKELIKNWIGYMDSQVWERFIRLASDRSELGELTGTSQRYSQFTETEQEKREHLLRLFVETVQEKNTSLNSLMLKHEFFRLLEQTERQEEIEQIWKLTDADVVLMESAKDWRTYETTTTTLSEQKELIKNWIGYMDSQVWERFIRLASDRSELSELTGTSQRYSQFTETEQEKREHLLHLFVETVQEKNTSLNSLMLKHEFFRLLEQTEKQEEIEQIWKLTDADVVLMESAKDWRTYETTTTTLSEQKELIKNWIGYMDSQVWERFIRLASDRSELSELTGTSQRYSQFTETEQEKREHLLHLFVETVQEKNTSLNFLMLKREFFQLLEQTERQEEIEQIWKLTDADVVLMESAKDWRTYETTTTTLSEQKELIKNWIGYMDSQVWERFIRLASERSELSELTETSHRYSRFTETEQEKREHLLQLFVETVQKKNTSQNSLMLKHEFFQLLEQTEKQEEIEQIWKLTDADIILMESAKDWRTHETTTTPLSEQKKLLKDWIGYMDSQVWERFTRLATEKRELRELIETFQQKEQMENSDKTRLLHVLENLGYDEKARIYKQMDVRNLYHDEEFQSQDEAVVRSRLLELEQNAESEIFLVQMLQKSLYEKKEEENIREQHILWKSTVTALYQDEVLAHKAKTFHIPKWSEWELPGASNQNTVYEKRLLQFVKQITEQELTHLYELQKTVMAAQTVNNMLSLIKHDSLSYSKREELWTLITDTVTHNPALNRKVLEHLTSESEAGATTTSSNTVFLHLADGSRSKNTSDAALTMLREIRSRTRRSYFVMNNHLIQENQSERISMAGIQTPEQMLRMEERNQKSFEYQPVSLVPGNTGNQSSAGILRTPQMPVDIETRIENTVKEQVKDIHVISRKNQDVSFSEEYDTKIKTLSEQVELQKQEIEEIKIGSATLMQNADARKIANKVMKQLQEQLRAERLRKGL